MAKLNNTWQYLLRETLSDIGSFFPTVAFFFFLLLLSKIIRLGIKKMYNKLRGNELRPAFSLYLKFESTESLKCACVLVC